MDTLRFHVCIDNTLRERWPFMADIGHFHLSAPDLWDAWKAFGSVLSRKEHVAGKKSAVVWWWSGCSAGAQLDAPMAGTGVLIDTFGSCCPAAVIHFPRQIGRSREEQGGGWDGRDQEQREGDEDKEDRGIQGNKYGAVKVLEAK